MITFREFRQRLAEEFGLKERPLSELSFVPSEWNRSTSGLCWERLIPPGKRIRVSIPDYEDDVPMEPEEILTLCLKLKISPKVFGLPWN